MFHGLGEDDFFQSSQSLFQVFVFPSRFFQFLVQALDGGEGNAVGIDGGNMSIVRSRAEGFMKILSHRTNVLLAWRCLEVPPSYGETDHFLQHRQWGDGLKVLLGFTVADRIEALSPHRSIIIEIGYIG